MRICISGRQTGSNLSLEDVRSLTTGSPPSTPGDNPLCVTGSQIQSPEASPQTTEDTRPHVLTFVELKALIESGNTENIPHNKHIPDRVNVRDDLVM